MTDQSKRVGGVTPPPPTQQLDEKVLNAIRVLAPVLVPRIASSIGADEDETSQAVCRLVARGQVRVLHLGYLAPRDYEERYEEVKGWERREEEEARWEDSYDNIPRR